MFLLVCVCVSIIWALLKYVGIPRSSYERAKKTSDLKIASKQFLPFKICWALLTQIKTTTSKVNLLLCVILFPSFISPASYFPKNSLEWKVFKFLLTVSLLCYRWWTCSIHRIMYYILYGFTLYKLLLHSFIKQQLTIFRRLIPCQKQTRTCLEEHGTWTFFKR